MNLTEELGAWRSLHSPLITIKVRFNDHKQRKWHRVFELKQCAEEHAAL